MSTKTTKAVEKSKSITSKKSNHDLAKDIVLSVSQELHIRVGIGPIWRQLTDTRKKEIVEKWEADIVQLLEVER